MKIKIGTILVSHNNEKPYLRSDLFFKILDTDLELNDGYKPIRLNYDEAIAVRDTLTILLNQAERQFEEK